MSNQANFSIWPKRLNLNILKAKKAFKMKSEAFFIIFKGFIEANEITFMEGESPSLSELNNLYLHWH